MRVEAWRHSSGGPEQGVAVRGAARRRLGIGAITALAADTPPTEFPVSRRAAADRSHSLRSASEPRPAWSSAPAAELPAPSRDNAGPAEPGSAPPSPLDRMAAALGVGVVTAEDLAAGAGRLVRVDRADGEAVTLIAVGYGESGPILAVPANPARLGDLARILAVEPAAARRIRLADPAAFAAALDAATADVASAADPDAPDDAHDGVVPEASEGEFEDTPPPNSPTAAPRASPDTMRRPALRVVGTRRVEAALDGFRAAAGGCGAERTVTGRQAAILGGIVAAAIGAATLAPATTSGLTICLVAICFVGFAGLRVAAAIGVVGGGFAPPAQPLADIDLPLYTVLVPLHREARVVPRLLPALCALDYPADKLDLKLLLEASDRETIAAVERHPLAHRFDVVTVPKVGPLTKPKALGVGLTLARGSLVTIFDAEDRPDPDQLRRAAETFAAAGPALACVQARLATDHAGDTWITAMFALEYAMLFDAVLPWLASRQLPFLLGGTSNHFRGLMYQTHQAARGGGEGVGSGPTQSPECIDVPACSGRRAGAGRVSGALRSACSRWRSARSFRPKVSRRGNHTRTGYRRSSSRSRAS